MATETTAREAAQLRETLNAIADERLKAHMLAALDAFQAQQASPRAGTATATDATAAGSNDAIVVALCTKDVATKAPRDALFLAVHAILLESGFRVQHAPEGDSLPLPPNWDEHSGSGLFTATYSHENDTNITFKLQGLFVGNKFEIYLSDDKDHTHSIELSVDTYVSLSASSTNASDLLRDLAALRLKLTPFLQNIAPKRPQAQTTNETSSTRQPRSPPSGSEGQFGSAGSPHVIPPVGSGDILPPGLGGGDPSSQVGPDHPMFGRRYDPTRGPVPGARFDPYGPYSTDPQGPPRGFIGGPQPMRPHPAPGFHFGEPNPDHLRMPGDDEMMDPFGPRGGRRGGPGFPPQSGSGRFGSDFPPPFGSDHSFF